MQSQRRIYILKIKILKKKIIVMLAINNLINTLTLSFCNNNLILCRIFFLRILS
jgi:hypothetical protein